MSNIGPIQQITPSFVQAITAPSTVVITPTTQAIIPLLQAQRVELTARIAKIDALLAMLQKNPDVAVMFDLARELGTLA